MGETKTVSLRVSIESLDAVEKAGLKPTEVMREALDRKARELQVEAWVVGVKKRRRPAPRGFPRAEDTIRADRDSDHGRR